MTQDKCWTVYNALKSVLATLNQTETPQLYSNVSAAVSSAKDLLISVLQSSGNT